jgi:IS1 family transposase
MRQLATKDRARIVACLVEGCSIRATCRMTGAAKKTVLKLVVDLGQACSEYQHRTLRNLPCRRVQCDEIWAFCYAKDKNVPETLREEGVRGSVWTWIALDADSKLIISYSIGTRDAWSACHFMRDVAGRLANRVQLTTDGHKAYLEATYSAFKGELDYAMLVKLYGPAPSTGEARYSPAKCLGARIDLIDGEPDLDHVSTSYVERANLTIRMGVRRFTRLTNGFSKKVENHEHAVSLHTMHSNFCRPHETLSANGVKRTPAMEAGLTDHVWTLAELIALIPEPTVARWGSKRAA